MWLLFNNIDAFRFVDFAANNFGISFVAVGWLDGDVLLVFIVGQQAHGITILLDHSV